jgi:hypothetical protein
MSGESTRVRPDGSAWRKAQQDVAARNDAARQRGREERAKAERKVMLKRQEATRRGIQR